VSVICSAPQYHPNPPVQLQVYKRYFENIRQIQDHMVSKARKSQINIIESVLNGTNKPATIILDFISKTLKEEYIFKCL